MTAIVRVVVLVVIAATVFAGAYYSATDDLSSDLVIADAGRVVLVVERERGRRGKRNRKKKNPRRPQPVEEEPLDRFSRSPTARPTSSPTLPPIDLIPLDPSIVHTLKPIVVGGFGDSGTRAVRGLLEAMGVDMVSEDFTAPRSRDSMIFMNSKRAPAVAARNDARDAFARAWIGKPISIIDGGEDFKAWNAEIRPSELSLRPDTSVSQFASFAFMSPSPGEAFPYDAATLNAVHPELHKWAVNFTSAIVQNHYTMSSSQIFGFKHPRTALVMPLIAHATRNNAKFIHVIRDGRDVSTGINYSYYSNFCCLLYKARDSLQACASLKGKSYAKIAFDIARKARCESYNSNRKSDVDSARGADTSVQARLASWRAKRLLFWQDLNAMMLRYGLRDLRSNYFPLRIEDLVANGEDGPAEGLLEDLFDFLELPVERRNDTLFAVREMFTSSGKSSTFEGLRYPYALREKLRTGMYEGDAPRTSKEDFFGLEMFGYHVDEWKRAVSYAEWRQKLQSADYLSARVVFEGNDVYALGQRPWRERSL